MNREVAVAADENVLLQVDAVSEAEEEAALEAGYNQTDIEPSMPADDPAPPAETAPTAQEPVAEPAQEPQPTIQDLIAQIQAERAESQKMRDRMFGKIGELQQKIDSVRHTAQGISPSAREDLQAEFPELARMLFGNSSHTDSVPASHHAAEPEPPQEYQFQQAVQQPAAQDIEKNFERRLLKRDHPDWENIVRSHEFHNWKDTVLNPDDRAILDESWDADFISSKLAEYKAWTTAQANKAAAHSKKQQILEAAVTPKGIPRGGMTSIDDDDEEAAMELGFKSRSRR